MTEERPENRELSGFPRAEDCAHAWGPPVDLFGPAGGVSPVFRKCGALGLLVELSRLTGLEMPDIRYTDEAGLRPRDAGEAP